MKITQLEREADQAKMDLAETQKQLQELENKELRDIAEKARLQREFRKKMDAGKLKVEVPTIEKLTTSCSFSVHIRSTIVSLIHVYR